MQVISAVIVVSSKELLEELRPALDAMSVRVLFETPELPAISKEFLDRLDRMRPDVVILEMTHLPGPLEEVVKGVRATSGAPAVFAIHSSAPPDAILGALRAGASEYLYPPMAAPLQSAVERLKEVRRRADEKLVRKGKTIGFLSAKGGCGATMVACHVAVELAKVNESKVLLADLDLQAGSIGFLLKSKSPYSVADAARNLRRMDPSYWKGLVSNGIPNLEIISAPTQPAAKEVRPEDVKQVLSFARGQYQWTVIDLGRNLNPATLGLLGLVDETYLVTTPDVPALHHAKQIVQILLEAGYPASQLRVVLNRMSKRMEITLEELEGMLGASICATLSNDSEKLNEAYSEGRLLNGAGLLGQDLVRLSGKIAGIVEEKKKKFSLFG